MAKFELTHNGATIAGVEQGMGLPVIFLHSGVTDHRMWQPQFDAMDLDIQALAYDRRGFGLTQSDDVPYDDVDDLLAVLDHFSIGKVVLVGCSLGGGLAATFALTHPHRVAGVVLVAASIAGAPDIDCGPYEAAFDQQYENVEQEADADALNKFEARVWLDGVHGDEFRVQGENRDLFLAMNGLHLQHKKLSHKAQMPDVFSRLENIKAPLALIAGALDSIYFTQMNGLIADRIGMAQNLVMPRSGHFPNMDDPEQFNVILSDFLSVV